MKTETILTTQDNPFEKANMELNDIQNDGVLVKVIEIGVCHTDSTVINGEMLTPK
ncbi:hypothetical protein [Staphylococcus epidermidis]|uniref:hypothetical protein n=1 Tax=Staphylococcus epidermidis TaxID=1282 RepID=UPI003075BD8E|nr:hypothetical protein [Staphylococcus epidermidis]